MDTSLAQDAKEGPSKLCAQKHNMIYDQNLKRPYETRFFNTWLFCLMIGSVVSNNCQLLRNTNTF